MSIDAKLQIEVLADLIQHYVKGIIHHDQVEFIPNREGWLLKINYYNSSHQQVIEEKVHDFVIDAEKLLISKINDLKTNSSKTRNKG